MFGGVVVVGIEDDGEVGIGLEEFNEFLVVLVDVFALMLEVEVVVDAEGRVVDDVDAQFAHVALLSDFEAVAAHQLVVDVELEDPLLFSALHSNYNQPASLGLIKNIKLPYYILIN